MHETGFAPSELISHAVNLSLVLHTSAGCTDFDCCAQIQLTRNNFADTSQTVLFETIG